MSADEEGTHLRLLAYRREVIAPKVREHRGRIVKHTGDGALVEFASVVDAVRCAVDIQRLMAERNAEIPQDRQIQFRIGIKITYGDCSWARSDRKVCGSAEATRTGPNKYRNSVVGGSGKGQVLFAVVVEIANHHRQPKRKSRWRLASAMR